MANKEVKKTEVEKKEYIKIYPADEAGYPTWEAANGIPFEKDFYDKYTSNLDTTYKNGYALEPYDKEKEKTHSIKLNKDAHTWEYVLRENRGLSDAQKQERELLVKQDRSIRERNRLLADSDKYLVGDFPMSEEDKKLMIAWRSELYAMENSESFKNEGAFIFPQKPEYKKLV